MHTPKPLLAIALICLCTLLCSQKLSAQRKAVGYFEEYKRSFPSVRPLIGSPTGRGNRQKDSVNYNTSTDILDLLRKPKPGDDCNEPDYTKLRNYLHSMPYIDLSPKEDRKKNLVSPYAFSKAIKKNFSKVILGNEEIAKVYRYASVDLSETPSFDFTPLTIMSNVKQTGFRNVWGINFSGKMNDENIFNLKEWRTLAANISWTHILRGTTYYPDTKKDIKAEMACTMKPKIDDLINSYQKALHYACTTGCKVDKEALVDKFLEDFTDLEIEEAEGHWKKKVFWWLSINAGIKSDRFNYINKDSLTSGMFKFIDEEVLIPEFTVGLNRYEQKHNGVSLLCNIWAAAKQKHSLSEVYSATDFQNYNRVNDTVSRMKDDESIFITDFTEIDKKLVIDFGARVVVMSPYINASRKQQIGLAASFKRTGLVADANFPSLFRTELGIVIPFLTSDDESTFNLEIFRRWDTFSDFQNENNKMTGVRFNIPIANGK